MIKHLIAAATAAALLALGPASAAADGPLKFCTGGKTGNYYAAAVDIQAQAKDSVAIEVIETAGSWMNLERIMDKKCDAAIVQSDAYGVFMARTPGAKLNIERTTVLYQEYVHMVCNAASGIESVKDLDPKRHTVLVGPNGSGTQITWFSLTKQDPRFAVVPTLPIGGNRALAKVKDGSEAQCMLFVAGLKSGAMVEADRYAKDEKGKTQLKLVKIDVGRFDQVRDPKGGKVYTFADIPGGTYPAIQHGGWSNAVRTLAVDAVLIVSSDWIDANPGVYDKFVTSTLRAQPTIKIRMAPKN